MTVSWVGGGGVWGGGSDTSVWYGMRNILNIYVWYNKDDEDDTMQER